MRRRRGDFTRVLSTLGSCVVLSGIDGGRSIVCASTHSPFTDYKAIVYAYGVRLESPITFTGIGGDTLYMNGAPVFPVRSLGKEPRAAKRKEVSPALEPLPYDVRFEREDLMRQALYAKSVSMEHTIKRALTPEEIAQEAAAIFGQFPFIVRAEAAGNMVRFKFVDEEVDHGMAWSHSVADSTVTMTTVHQRIVAQIEIYLRSADLYAFGSDYELACGRGCAEETIRGVSKVNESTTIGQVWAYGLLREEQFLRDVKSALKQKGPK